MDGDRAENERAEEPEAHHKRWRRWRDDDDGKSRGESGTDPEISRLCLPLVRRKYARATMHTRTYLPSASAMFVVRGNTGRYGNAIPSLGDNLEARGGDRRTSFSSFAKLSSNISNLNYLVRKRKSL